MNKQTVAERLHEIDLLLSHPVKCCIAWEARLVHERKILRRLK